MLSSDTSVGLGLPRMSVLVLALLSALGLTGCLNSSSSSSSRSEGSTGTSAPELDAERVLPIVFVHGLAGSGSQYQTQAMRFASNEYPDELVSAFEYSTNGTAAVISAAGGGQNAALDAFVDALLAASGSEQLYLVCHSLGTAVCANYLSDPLRAEKVARYVGVDGQRAETCPGDVPCLGIFVDPEARLGEHNLYLPGESHVQVATSEASFAGQFEFFTGIEPQRHQIVELDGAVQVAGRAVYFPANEGAEGATLQVWRVATESGVRLDDAPLASQTLDATGEFGPLHLDTGVYYEFQLLRPGRAEHHFYRQPFLRDTALLRLNTSPAGSAIEANTHTGPDHATLVISRDMEWWADRGESTDVLEISSTSTLWGDEPLHSVLRTEMGNGLIGIHVHDAEATPAVTTGELLPYFPTQPFQTGVDVNMPATSPPDGSIRVVSKPRGDATREQVLNMPNWASSAHRISVVFNDFVQD